jgi:hypothetical protein
VDAGGPGSAVVHLLDWLVLRGGEAVSAGEWAGGTIKTVDFDRFGRLTSLPEDAARAVIAEAAKAVTAWPQLDGLRMRYLGRDVTFSAVPGGQVSCVISR